MDVCVMGEQRVEAGGLLVGEQAGAGVQRPAGRVERVAGATAMPAVLLLDAHSALVQGIAGERDDVERVHHRDCLGSSSLVAVL